ncbi:GNAT family N-acetyltransferase [Actinoplanes sp. NPDC051851]|uniref:GNAT family N-acetyltransferase n=1 Tax=Actinoplanes sp. NPDC051851 TaxID=3154753 RepID=UPI003412F2EE
MPSLTTPALATGTLAALLQPEITGDGVLLRPWREADHPAVVTAYADPAVQRWHCRSMTAAEALDWIGAWPAHWRAESRASWAVTLPSDGGTVAGQIGLRGIALAEGLAAISYWVLPAHRGNRIAPRALAALTTWSFTTLGLHRLELHHSTANLPSCRVAEHAGYRAEGVRRSSARHTDGWHDMHTHARLPTD